MAWSDNFILLKYRKSFQLLTHVQGSNDRQFVRFSYSRTKKAYIWEVYSQFTVFGSIADIVCLKIKFSPFFFILASLCEVIYFFSKPQNRSIEYERLNCGLLQLCIINTIKFRIFIKCPLGRLWLTTLTFIIIDQPIQVSNNIPTIQMI